MWSRHFAGSFCSRPSARCGSPRRYASVYAGLFANLVFPLRPGEVLRSYLLSNSEDISIGRVLGSVGVERLIDLVIATASLGVASLFVELPRIEFQRAADILGIVSLVLVGIIVFADSLPGVQARHEPGTLARASSPSGEAHGSAHGIARDGHCAELLPGGACVHRRYPPARCSVCGR